jgi:glutathione synthase/RimK-type ligase-like ATP-grasp enzyme
MVHNSEQLDCLKKSFTNQRIALKELDSHGGEKVFVGFMNDYQNNLQFPLLAQEFVDTSGGYDNLAHGIHDVRVAVFSGKAIHGLLREPGQPGELRTNQDLGGRVRALYVAEIPAELIEKIKVIDQRFGVDKPRFFSADFGFNGREWKLFELNNAPGLSHSKSDGPAANEFLELLAENLIASATCHQKR